MSSYRFLFCHVDEAAEDNKIINIPPALRVT